MGSSYSTGFANLVSIFNSVPLYRMVKITGVGALTLYVLILKLQPALERFHIIDVITEKYICYCVIDVIHL